MKKFCCATWQSAVKQVQDTAGYDLDKAGLLKDALVEAISLWPNYCPSCGLSLASDFKPEDAVSPPSSKAQSTHPITCQSCRGNGHAGGAKDSTAKCMTCIGTGKVTINKNVGDKLANIEDLKTKIRRENKPVRTDENE